MTTMGDVINSHLLAAYGVEPTERMGMRIPPRGEAGPGYLFELSDRTVWAPAEMLDNPERPIPPGRWLCVECQVEGRGPTPPECPDCWSRDAWYATRWWDSDHRPMTRCHQELWGAVLNKPEGTA